MLYTVMPLERVYARPASYTDIRQEKPQASNAPQYQEVTLPHGRIMTRQERDGYIIERVSSTDMRDYLNEAYSPGRNMPI